MSSSRLSIKSLPSAAPGTPAAKPAYAVLCTPSQSFHLRQVQTSNSLYLTQPALEAHGNPTPAPTTRAMALCSTTLELHPAVDSAVPYLADALPLYHVEGLEVDAQANHASKAALFAHIPLSNGQCEHAWAELMAFELAGSSYRPSATSLAQSWQSIHAAALAQGIALDRQFLTADLAKLVEEEGYPAPLTTAILAHLSDNAHDAHHQWSCLDPAKATAFVGKTLLQANRGKADLLTADFLDAWKDSLPEAWRAGADLQAIQGVYDLPSSTTPDLDIDLG